MNKNWFWIGKYVIVIVAALILGAVLGNLQLFKNATLGTPKLTAGALSEFIAHGGALALLWLLGDRLARQFRQVGGGLANMSTTVLALVTLIVVASAYVVLLHFITPFLARDVKPFLDWTFIVGILAAAIWLVWALYNDAEAIFQAIGKAAGNRGKAANA
jgi:hypothetical protein